jgi:hypothetical protein
LIDFFLQVEIWGCLGWLLFADLRVLPPVFWRCVWDAEECFAGIGQNTFVVKDAIATDDVLAMMALFHDQTLKVSLAWRKSSARREARMCMQHQERQLAVFPPINTLILWWWWW